MHVIYILAQSNRDLRLHFSGELERSKLVAKQHQTQHGHSRMLTRAYRYFDFVRSCQSKESHLVLNSDSRQSPA